MPLWNRYQECLRATEPAALLDIVGQFEQVVLTGSEPPAWITSWGAHAARQPLRTAVDPAALGAACTIRTASVLVGRNRPADARLLYERVLARYPRSQWTYYHDQARDALASLAQADSAAVAMR